MFDRPQSTSVYILEAMLLLRIVWKKSSTPSSISFSTISESDESKFAIDLTAQTSSRSCFSANPLFAMFNRIYSVLPSASASKRYSSDVSDRQANDSRAGN